VWQSDKRSYIYRTDLEYFSVFISNYFQDVGTQSDVVLSYIRPRHPKSIIQQ
jgi:hypothetical protein